MEARNKIMFPLIVSSSTTIMAFLSLLFAKSQALHDFGLFTSLSLAGTLFFVLTAVPYLLSPFEKKIVFPKDNYLDSLMETIEIKDQKSNKWMLLAIGIITTVLLFFAFEIQFENDLNKLNFYPKTLKKAELALQNINPDTEKRINMLVSNDVTDKAIEINREVYKKLLIIERKGLLKETSSLGVFLIPNNEQEERISTWNSGLVVVVSS